MAQQAAGVDLNAEFAALAGDAADWAAASFAAAAELWLD